MGQRSSGTVRYGYRVKVDLQSIAEAIANRLCGDLEDWDFDDSDIMLEMSHEAHYESWYCKATMEEPDEYDIEVDDMIDDTYLADEVLNAFHLLKKEDISVKLEVDDETDWDFGEPYDPRYDENNAYDSYRDRYYDREYAERE